MPLASMYLCASFYHTILFPMKSSLFVTILSLLVFPLMLRAQVGAKTDIEISNDVLKTAEWAGFKYMEKLDLAQSGDQQAVKALYEFSGTVDGKEALQHATTCIELIPFATDEKVGAVISSLKPKLITILLDRFQLAQGRTQKEELKKPMQEWAPLTWRALHGERIMCNSCMQEGGLMAKKPTGMTPVKQSTETVEPAAATGKQ